MTPRQREHARLHQARNDGRFRTRLLDEGLSVNVISDAGPMPPVDARSFLVQMACTNDAMFIGHVTGRESFPTEDGFQLFTDYEVIATRVVKSPKGGFPSDSRVVVTRPGGERVVKSPKGGFPNVVPRSSGERVLEERRIAMTFSSYPTLEVGEDYVFFVEHLPKLGTFNTNQVEGVWHVNGGSMRPLVGRPFTDRSVNEVGLPVAEMLSLISDKSCGK
jgi:hypothetical protein